MVLSNSLRGSVVAALSVLAMTGFAHAQQTGSAAVDTSFQPTVGQAGKDVVWVPTPQTLVDQMLDMAKLTPKDVLVDLGSGDGRTVITAAKRGATARGIEYNPDMVAISVKAAQEAGVTDKAKFIRGDIFETNFTDANVITLFLLPTLNVRLRPTILEMAPGTRVVSNSFSMGDWEPDESVNVTQDCSGYCTALLWIVPAKVGGNWTLPGGSLEIKQNYQQLEGNLKQGTSVLPISDARMNGKAIEFKAGGRQYKGEVDGNRMGGMIDGKTVWAATR